MPQAEVTGGRERAGGPDPSSALGVGNPVEDVQPGGDHQARAGVADPADDLADEPRSILERAAILARARTGGQQLVQEVAVALLDVDEIETGRAAPAWPASTYRS